MFLRLLYIHFICRFFFIASGFVLFHNTDTIKSRIQKLSKGILVPYVLFNIVYIIFFKIIDILSTKNELHIEIKNKLIAILVANPYGEYVSYLWFLPCIFLAKLLILCLGERFLSVISIISFLIFLLFNHINTPPISIPWSLENVFLAIPCIYIGYILKRYKISDIRIILICSILWLVLFYFQFRSFQFNGNVEIYCNVYGNIVLFVCTALFGGIALVAVCQRIGKNKILEEYGRNSLSIYCIHYLFLVPINKIISLFFVQNSLSFVIIRPIIVFMLLMVIMIPVCKMVNKRISWIIGRF